MTLPVPVLDDRTYDQLVAELRGRIAAYAPDWTDQGASDPGITLLELFAFLGENLLFRFNQIPDATRLWLLRLLQDPPLPARPSSGLVTLAPRDPRGPSRPNPLQVDRASILRAGTMPFETGQDLTSLPLTARAVVKSPAKQPSDPELVAGVQRAIDARGGLTGAESASLYTTEALRVAPGGPGVASLDVAGSIDRTLWLAVIAGAGLKVADLLTKGSSIDGQVLNVGVSLTDQFPSMDQVDRCSGLDPVPARGSAPPPPQSIWLISTVETLDLEPVYVPIEVVSDTTAGLTRDGVVRLQLPEGLLAGGAPVGTVTVTDPDVVGTGNLPPRLDDNPAVVFWLRAYPAPGAPSPGALQWIGLNAVTVDQMETVGPELVGTGTGMPNQQYRLVNRSVDPGSLILQVEEHGVWVTWQRVETFATSTGNDRHYVLDAAEGVVSCGDTLRGRAFPTGGRIRAVRYRHGGGSSGNVAPKAIAKVDSGAPVIVENPLPLKGGADAETIADALSRIPGEFARHDRAVTASDFRELSGIVGVARAECLPHFYPRTRDLEAAGVVTVMVWPTQDTLHPDAPMPDAALLRAVCARLDARRLVTTELYVVPPTYRQVAVSVGVVVKPGYSGTAVCRWVERVVRQYLSPLPPFGPDGQGWPLGRAVLAAELMAAALQVEGIDYLNDLQVASPDGKGGWVPGTVQLHPWEVVEVTTLTAQLGPALPPGTPPPQPSTPTLVPIPVPQAEC